MTTDLTTLTDEQLEEGLEGIRAYFASLKELQKNVAAAIVDTQAEIDRGLAEIARRAGDAAAE